MKKQLLVIHGPNINLTGIREPGVYGSESLEQINEEMPSFLVEPFQMEPFLRFRLKRFLEKGILKRYRKKERRKNL